MLTKLQSSLFQIFVDDLLQIYNNRLFASQFDMLNVLLLSLMEAWDKQSTIQSKTAAMEYFTKIIVHILINSKQASARPIENIASLPGQFLRSSTALEQELFTGGYLIASHLSCRPEDLKRFELSGRCEAISRNLDELFRAIQHPLFETRFVDFLIAKCIVWSSESAIAFRTRAIRSLVLVLPIMNRDIQAKLLKIILPKLMDVSGAVRDSVCEFVSTLIMLNKNENAAEQSDLNQTLYDTLSVRVLDTSVAVRKRIIRFLQ